MVHDPLTQCFQGLDFPGILLDMECIRAHQRAGIVLQALRSLAHLAKDLPGLRHGQTCRTASARVCSSGDCISASSRAMSAALAGWDRFSSTHASLRSM
jgi:hypothetical protein